jgi:iduronate 2-sulfatase
LFFISIFYQMKSLISLTLFCAAATCSSQEKEKPNVLFIMVDDLRPVLGTYDYPSVHSPNIDRLASQGVQFNNAFCNVPVSGASRASLLTGLRPQWPVRFNNFESWADKDSPAAVSLPEYFKKNGYTTVSNGKVFHHQFDKATSWSELSWRPDTFSVIHSFDLDYADSSSIQFINKETGAGPYFECSTAPDSLYFDSKVAAKSIIDMQRLARAGKPFFLAVGFHKPHLPFNAPKKYYDLYDSIEIARNRYPPLNLPKQVTNSKEIFRYGRLENYNSEEFHHEARRAYYACVSYVDSQIGRLLQSLKDLGLEKNTIVVILGDHGWHLGEHNFWGKHNVLYNALHSPLIIKAPGIKPEKLDDIVEFVDIYPTLCNLASLKLPAHLQGISMVSLMKNRKASWKNQSFSEWQGARTIKTSRYSYSYWFEEKNKGAQMLFDHEIDPDENENVVGKTEYKEVVDRLKQTLDSLYSGI